MRLTAHHVERVGDLHGVVQHRVEHGPIRRRQVQRRPADPLTPPLWSGNETGARRHRVAARHDVEQLTGLHVDDLG